MTISESPTPGRNPTHLLRVVGLHAGLYLLSLLGTATIIGSVDSIPFWSWSRARVIEAVRPDAKYDLLFVGSSRITYAIKPEVVDRMMGEAGIRSNSYNASLTGTRPHDFSTILEWISRNNPGSIRTAVIELYSWEAGNRDGNWMSDFEVELHSMPGLPSRARSILLSRLPWHDKAYYLYFDTIHCLRNVLRIGQGQRILKDTLDRSQGVPLTGVYPIANRGFVAQETVDYEPGRRAHEDFLSRLEEYQRHLEWKKSSPSTPETRAPFDATSLKQQADALRLHGIEPIYVVMPSYHVDIAGLDHIEGSASDITIIRMDKVADYPDLYRTEHWFDTLHMTSQGAEYFSKLLAERLAQNAALRRTLEFRQSQAESALRIDVDRANPTVLRLKCSLVGVKTTPAAWIGVSRSLVAGAEEGQDSATIALSAPLLHLEPILVGEQGTAMASLPAWLTEQPGPLYVQAAVVGSGSDPRFSAPVRCR